MMAPVLLLAACLPFSGAGDRIRPTDLAAAEPALAALPEHAMLGFAPAPGAQRTFGVAEIERIARKYGVAVEPKAGICLERRLLPLKAEDILAVLEDALGVPGARLELVDYSRYAVP